MAATISNSAIHVTVVVVMFGIIFLYLPTLEGSGTASRRIWNSITQESAQKSRRNLSKCRITNTSDGLAANCIGLGLSAVPQDLPLALHVLDLGINNLTVLHNHSFTHLPNLLILTLSVNPLFFIQSKTLWPLTKLRTLEISNCKLMTMSPQLFVKNMLITKLTLYDNQLDSVPCKALGSLPRLSGLELSSNNIHSLNFKGCSRWSELIYINLMGNKLKEIHQKDFLHLQHTTVATLSLQGNNIDTLSTKAFSHLTSIEKLQIDGNLLQALDIRPFLGMTFIKKLSMMECKIHQLLPPDNNTHEQYPSILNLDLSFNLIENVPLGSFWGFTWLRVLDLSDNKIGTLTNESFCQLRSLSELDISNNRLVSLQPWFFKGMPLIQSISLSGNKINDINSDKQMWTLDTLQMLDISFNDISTVSEGVFFGLTNLKVLNMSHNQIDMYSEYAFRDLATLKELHLSNEKETLLGNTFRQLRTVLFLDLSHAEIFGTPYPFFNMTHLQELHLENVQLKHTMLFSESYNRSIFSGIYELKKLRLKDNYLTSLEGRVFRNLSELYHLDMTNCRIQVLKQGVFRPLASLRILELDGNELIEIVGDIFQGHYQLSVVNLINNNLRGLDPATFAQCPKLTKLTLSSNQINTIKPGTVLPTNTSLRLDVSMNPFTCTCSLKWFSQWLKSANIDLEYPEKTLCSETSLNGLKDQPITSFHPEDHCGVNIVLIVVLCLTSLLIGMTVVLAYNKRWWLNHKLFLLKLAVIGYEEMAEDFDVGNYLHHLNIMFQEADQEWVDQVMKPGLEERLPHLQNIIFGDGGLHLGMYYIEALYDAIDNSFKTVLLLSNHSVDDAWTMTKLRMALEHLNDTGLDKVILIFVENIDDDHLPYLVRLFLSRNKPYMLWTDDEDGQQLFWAQFEKSMRANKAINNHIPL